MPIEKKRDVIDLNKFREEKEKKIKAEADVPGHWIRGGFLGENLICSKCGVNVSEKPFFGKETPYCPYCGTPMHIN